MAGRMFHRFCRDPLGELMHPPRGQVAALDALRACAVLMVIFRHASGDYVDMGGQANAWGALPFVRGGWMGVDLFFVLSGYLIGKQLWRELQSTGTVRFGRFFLRRGFRIWPLYFFILAFSVLVVHRGKAPLGWWWSDAVFLTNYARRGIVPGSWSLCTEEQFYLITPLAVLIGASFATPMRRYRWYLMATIALLPAIRVVEWWALTGDLLFHDQSLVSEYLYTPIHAHADGLVVGLLLAHLDLVERGRYRQGVFGPAWVLLAGAAACAGLILVSGKFFNFTGISLFFGSLIWWLLGQPRRWLGWLDSQPFYILSRLSFGMYLNHQFLNAATARLMLRHVSLPLGSAALHNILTTAVLVALSALAATVTFCLIEHPFLRLREVVLDRARAAPAEHVPRHLILAHAPRPN
jgi:peptidoglycan/LPS O-acetylase OafA/YrhL